MNFLHLSLPSLLCVKQFAPQEMSASLTFSDAKIDPWFRWLLCLTFCIPKDCCPWNSPGHNTRVGSLSLIPGDLPNPGILHCRQILYQLSHKGNPRIPEWVAYPFSIGPCQSRNWTRVSCIAGGFFPNWAIREALAKKLVYPCFQLGVPKIISHNTFVFGLVPPVVLQKELPLYTSKGCVTVGISVLGGEWIKIKFFNYSPVPNPSGDSQHLLFKTKQTYRSIE